MGVGRIINISSSSAKAGSGFHHLAASKGGVIGFTKARAIELADTGVTVTDAAPGLVNTEGLRAAQFEVEKVASVSPMNVALML